MADEDDSARSASRDFLDEQNRRVVVGLNFTGWELGLGVQEAVADEQTNSKLRWTQTAHVNAKIRRPQLLGTDCLVVIEGQEVSLSKLDCPCVFHFLSDEKLKAITDAEGHVGLSQSAS